MTAPQLPRPHGIRRIASASTVAGDLAALTAAEVAIRLLNFGVIAVVARSLGVVALGQLTLAQVAMTLALVIGDAGLSADGIRRMGRGEPRGPLVSTTTTAQLLMTLLTASATVAAVSAIDRDGQLALLVLTMAPLALAYAFNLGWTLQAERRMASWGFWRFIGQLVTTLVTLLALSVGLGIAAVAVAMWLGALVTDAGIALAVVRQGLRLHLPAPRAVMRRISGGRAYLAYSFVTFVSPNFALFAAGIALSATELGHFSAAFRVAYLACAPSVIVGRVALPLFSQVTAVGKEALRIPFVAVLVATGLVVLPAAALLLSESGDVLELVFGTGVNEGAAVLSVLAAWVPLNYLTTVLSNALLALDRPSAQFRASASGAAVLALLLAPTITVLGGVGAACSIVVAELVSVLVAARALRYEAQLSSFDYLRGFPYAALALVASLIVGAMAPLELRTLGRFVGWGIGIAIAELGLGSLRRSLGPAVGWMLTPSESSPTMSG